MNVLFSLIVPLELHSLAKENEEQEKKTLVFDQISKNFLSIQNMSKDNYNTDFWIATVFCKLKS